MGQNQHEALLNTANNLINLKKIRTKKYPAIPPPRALGCFLNF